MYISEVGLQLATSLPQRIIPHRLLMLSHDNLPPPLAPRHQIKREGLGLHVETRRVVVQRYGYLFPVYYLLADVATPANSGHEDMETSFCDVLAGADLWEVRY